VIRIESDGLSVHRGSKRYRALPSAISQTNPAPSLCYRLRNDLRNLPTPVAFVELYRTTEESDEYCDETSAIPVATVALLGFSSLAASARVVCNADGDCWHIHEDSAYPPAAGLIIHPDNWRWKEGEHHVWREHPGRGYWKGGEWAPF
jgi:hypothetical protein